MQAFRKPGETGGERPHKRLAKFDPFRTSRRQGEESLKWCCLAVSSTGLPLRHFPGNGFYRPFSTVLKSSDTLAVDDTGESLRSHSVAGVEMAYIAPVVG
jgi:hypothetical protein